MKIWSSLLIVAITFVTSCNQPSKENRITGKYSSEFETSSIYSETKHQNLTVLNITHVKDDNYGIKATMTKDGDTAKSKTQYYEYTFNPQERILSAGDISLQFSEDFNTLTRLSNKRVFTKQ
ncbi:MAG: hypothetical protein ACTIJ9_16655 [Aequorivita sp.]